GAPVQACVQGFRGVNPPEVRSPTANRPARRDAGNSPAPSTTRARPHRPPDAADHPRDAAPAYPAADRSSVPRIRVLLTPPTQIVPASSVRTDTCPDRPIAVPWRTVYEPAAIPDATDSSSGRTRPS